MGAGSVWLSRFALGVIAAGVMLAAVITAVTALRGADAGAAAPRQAAPIPVQAGVATYLDAVQIEQTHPGLVRSRRSSTLGFESGGRIDAMFAEIGDRVAAGAELARLDVRALEASLASARAETEALEAQTRLAEVTLDRQRRLTEQGHVSAQALDRSEADFNAARARAAAARAGADQISVRIELARLLAPYDAVVIARHADEGAIAAPGAPVLTIEENGALEISVGLPADAAGEVNPGETHGFEIDGVRREARLRSLTGVISPQGRTVEAVFDLADADPVRSGAVARLIRTATLEQRGFWAPMSALAEGRRGLWSVYVLEPEDAAFRLEPRPVEILHSEAERVYLTGAVEEGARILSAGVHRVTPGQRVTPQPGG
ncbi:MAG: efflux RND transporter periplasmic adaptor subunit [Oceanicaulis sp.]